MAETVKLVDPQIIHPNPDNPRLIFHQEELDALQESIRVQGILVPLTIYKDGGQHVLLDGERRWRCALKLGLERVPVNVQPKPEPMLNLMMMFAIHHRRDEWDPLPTAFKLQQLENLYRQKNERSPTETELASLSSLTRGEVRRLKSLLQLPQAYIDELMEELKKPRSKQMLKVDHVLETVRGTSSLRKREVIQNQEEEERLRRAIVDKFRAGVITNTVSPRKLARLARGVERAEISLVKARGIVKRLVDDPKFTIDMAFDQSVEVIDFQHNFHNLVGRMSTWVDNFRGRDIEPSKEVRSALKALRIQIDEVLEGK